MTNENSEKKIFEAFSNCFACKENGVCRLAMLPCFRAGYMAALSARYSLAREVYLEYVAAFDAEEQPPDYLEYLSSKET